MRFTTGGPAYDVKWFFTKPHTKALPFETTFNSRNWTAQEKPWPEIGEIEGAPRLWSNGSPPGNTPSYEPYGTEDEFLEGQSTEEPSVPLNDACEVIYPVPDAGGIEIGGDCTEDHVKWTTSCCPLGLPRQMTVWFRQFADENPAFTSPRTLIHVSFLNLLGCAWTVDGHDYGLFLFCSAGPSNFLLTYIVDGVQIRPNVSPLNVKNCADWKGLYNGQWLPADPDPFKFYLYDLWVTKPGDPRPW
jgi:hypothetical protein